MPKQAEIIPFEPDTGNAGAGNKNSICALSCITSLGCHLKLSMVTINNKNYPLEESQKLLSLLASFEIAVGKGMAIAVNEMVVPKALWNDYTINNNDKIIVIKATQGG